MRNEPVLYANKLKRNLNVPDKKKKAQIRLTDLIPEG